ncbi:MAG: hypothetical protein RIG61_09990 [Deltaproteobacteria bacterium]
MEVDRIVRLVTETLPEVNDPPGIEYLNPDSSAYKINTLYHVSVPELHEQRLIELLSKQPELSQYDGGNASRSPSSSQSVRLKNFSDWILAQSRFRDPKEVVNQLETFVNQNTTTCTEVVVFWGIHPAEIVEVYNGIKLLPLESLAASVPKEDLIGVNRYVHPVDKSFSSSPRPRAALAREFEHSPILKVPGDSTKSGQDKSRQQLMEEIVHLLVVFDKTPVCKVAHWYQTEENTPLIGGVRAWSGISANLGSTLNKEIPQKKYEATSLQSFIKQYVELKPEIKDQLRTPLERLNSAMLWYSSGDVYNAAIDLRTAMESLLTYDLEHDAPIAFNIRLRGALLLGGEYNVKNWNYERFKLLYKICSHAVHKGKVKRTYSYTTLENVKERKSPHSVLAEGFELHTQLIEKIIEDGEFPDWDKLVLGITE